MKFQNTRENSLWVSREITKQVLHKVINNQNGFGLLYCNTGGENTTEQILQNLTENDFWLRILHSAKLTVQGEGKIKAVSDT